LTGVAWFGRLDRPLSTGVSVRSFVRSLVRFFVRSSPVFLSPPRVQGVWQLPVQPERRVCRSLSRKPTYVPISRYSRESNLLSSSCTNHCRPRIVGREFDRDEGSEASRGSFRERLDDSAFLLARGKTFTLEIVSQRSRAVLFVSLRLLTVHARVPSPTRCIKIVEFIY